MKKETAIQHAGGPRPLADLLGITPSAVSQWEEEIPEHREWQLRVLRPEWFRDEPAKLPQPAKAH